MSGRVPYVTESHDPPGGRVGPTLTVVCGAPASGKTILARRLAKDLRLPLLEKDAIKESLANTLGAADRDESRCLGFASTRLLYKLAASMIRRGTSVIIECSFVRTFASADLERTSDVARVLVVQCRSSRETVLRRCRERYMDGERHAAHFDAEALTDLGSAMERDAYNLSTFGYPTVSIDTTDGLIPDYSEIASRIQQHVS